MTATRLLRHGTIEEFVVGAGATPGLHLSEVEPLTTLLVRTRNSDYRITIASDGSTLVQGGRYFPEDTAATFEGASLGGSLLKVGWIGLGLRMEFRQEGRRIVTSPVAAIASECAVGRRVH
jgi:hypothetical protein